MSQFQCDVSQPVSLETNYANSDWEIGPENLETKMSANFNVVVRVLRFRVLKYLEAEV